MSQVEKIASAALNNMGVEDLLALDGNMVELVTDIPVVPAGYYHFTVKDAEVDQLGKEGEQKPYIVVNLELNAVEKLDNAADQSIVDQIDLANNPVKYREAFGLQTKDGFGVRSFVTFTHQLAQDTGVTQVGARLEILPGAQGVAYIGVNTYLPANKADVPENYKTNNRMDVKQVVWA